MQRPQSPSPDRRPSLKLQIGRSLRCGRSWPSERVREECASRIFHTRRETIRRPLQDGFSLRKMPGSRSANSPHESAVRVEEACNAGRRPSRKGSFKNMIEVRNRYEALHYPRSALRVGCTHCFHCSSLPVAQSNRSASLSSVKLPPEEPRATRRSIAFERSRIPGTRIQRVVRRTRCVDPAHRI